MKPGKEINDALLAQFKDYLDAALDHLSWAMPSDAWLDAEVDGERHEMTACVEDVPCPAELLQASLLNALHCFHEKMEKIHSVTLVPPVAACVLEC